MPSSPTVLSRFVCWLLVGVLGWQSALFPALAAALPDADGRVVKTILPDGATSQTHYNSIGKVDYTVDALRRVTSYHTNTLGQRDQTTYADGTGSTTSYDENGEVVGSVDRSGRGSQSLYDTLGRVTNSLSLGTQGQTFTHTDGTLIQSQTQYDDAGQAGASIDELNHISRTQYDAAGEALASTVYDDDGTGQANLARTSTTQYDADGRAVQSTDALGRYSIPTYDGGGRVTQSTLFDRNGVAISTSSTHYDALGRVDYSTDASGHQKRLVYDALSRLSAVIQATQGVPTSDGSGAYDLVTRFQYDEVGHKIAQQDANRNITRFGYDVRGRMIWRALPMGQVEGMSYDAGGQLQSSTDFRGYLTSCSYDQRGRLVAKVPDSRLREATLTYGYPDENTRINYRGASATKQSYDKERGWLNSVSGPNGTVSYSYNPEGQKLAMTAPSGTTGYGYDVMGRLALINDQPTGAAAATSIASYAYDAVGNLASLTRGNGVQTRYAYDEQNRLSDLVNTGGAGDLSRFHYTLRADGKRTGIGENVVDAPDATTGAARSSVRSLAYTYDNAGKLTSETGQDGLGVAYQNTWNYDAVGNRTSATVQKAASAGATTWAHTTSVSAVFNANDQLTSQSSSVDGGAAAVQNFAYDANGAEAGTSTASGTSANSWDFEGKLTQTALVDAAGQAAGGSANSFDAAGDRLSHTDNLGKTGQKTTSYLVDTDTAYSQVIEERAPDVSDAAGNPALQARYVWGGGLAPLAMWRKMPDGSVKLFFHLSDGQESVRQLTDASGAVVDAYFYDAWGNTLDGSSNHVANPFRYTGQQRDADGKYYLRARFYNPGTGRFLSHDPLMGNDSDPVSMHRYLYAGGDGIDGCDPSGQLSIVETETYSYGTAQVSANRDTRTVSTGARITYTFRPLVQLPPTPLSPWEVVPPAFWAVGGAAITTPLVFAAIALDSYSDQQKIQKNQDDDTLPDYVYKSGSNTDTNFTPRPGKDDIPGQFQRGLSTFDTPERAAQGQSKVKYQKIDVKKATQTGALFAYADGVPGTDTEGHVSFRPLSDTMLQQWAATRPGLANDPPGAPHALTGLMRAAVVDQGKTS